MVYLGVLKCFWLVERKVMLWSWFWIHPAGHWWRSVQRAGAWDFHRPGSHSGVKSTMYGVSLNLGILFYRVRISISIKKWERVSMHHPVHSRHSNGHCYLESMIKIKLNKHGDDSQSILSTKVTKRNKNHKKFLWSLFPTSLFFMIIFLY